MHLHEQRRVTLPELLALLGVRSAIDSGLITGARGRQTHGLNMNLSYMSIGSCGSVACIGGYMALVLGKKPERYVAGRYSGLREQGHPDVCSEPLIDLFFPDAVIGWDRITPTHCVQAIDNWLAHGNPLWRRVTDDVPNPYLTPGEVLDEEPWVAQAEDANPDA